MNRDSLVAVLLTILGCGFIGCAFIGCGGEEASPEPASSAAGRPGAVEKVLDQAGYCSSVCQRATSCGLESAESLARVTPGEVALIGKLKAEATDTEQACVAECRKEPLDQADASSLAAAERCIEQTTCDTFARCLGGSASAGNP